MLKKGFTLIELLVVIAIIAILAAIIFPVFSRVKDSAYRSSDLSNMNALRTALQLYRQDQGGYPPALLGYVTQYQGGLNPTTNDMIPANALVSALYPKRVDSLDTFRPAYDRPTAGTQYTAFTSAVWPNQGGADSLYPPSSNITGVQKYGPSQTVQRCVDLAGDQAGPSYYYSISGYDAAVVPWEPGLGNGAKNRTEIHYSPFWSTYTVATDPCRPTSSETGSPNDDPRQLGYLDPPETTVVTWDSYFRDYQDGAVQRTKKDLVLFSGGSARAYDSAAVAAASWMVTP